MPAADDDVVAAVNAEDRRLLFREQRMQVERQERFADFARYDQSALLDGDVLELVAEADLVRGFF